MCALIASVNGVVSDPADAHVPVTDEGLLRGDGVFEVDPALRRPAVRAGRPLRRMARSAANLRLEIDLGALQGEIDALLGAGRARSTRRCGCVVTRGGQPRRPDRGAPGPARETLRARAVTYAPTRVLDGVKSLSYAANMLAEPAGQGAGRRRGAARHAARPRARGADVRRSSASLDGAALHAAAGATTSWTRSRARGVIARRRREERIATLDDLRGAERGVPRLDAARGAAGPRDRRPRRCRRPRAR